MFRSPPQFRRANTHTNKLLSNVAKTMEVELEFYLHAKTKVIIIIIILFLSTAILKHTENTSKKQNKNHGKTEEE